MIPLEARINWRHRFLNPPMLEILVDHMPDMEQMVYNQTPLPNGSLYYAEKDGYVSFYYHKPSDPRGFGGRVYNLILDTGELVTINGPWSSRSGSMNKAGYGPCMDACMVTDKESYDRGHTFMSGNITVELGEEIAEKFLDGIFIVKEITPNGEIVYTPSIEADKVVKRE